MPCGPCRPTRSTSSPPRRDRRPRRRRAGRATRARRRRARPRGRPTGRRGFGSPRAAGHRRSSRRRTRARQPRGRAATSRAVAGAIAFQSETSGRAPVRLRSAGDPGGDPERLVGRRDREDEVGARRRRRRATAAARARPRARAHRPLAPPGDGRDDTATGGEVGGSDRAPHRPRTDDPNRPHCRDLRRAAIAAPSGVCALRHLLPQMPEHATEKHAPGRIRTSGQRIRSPSLCPLSYGRSEQKRSWPAG